MVYPTRRPSAGARSVALRHTPDDLRAWCWMVSGVLAVFSALGLFLIDPVEQIVTWQTSLSPGTFAYNFFVEPLDVLFIRAYLFNITNPEAFLNGEEKMHMQEVGPFMYREVTRFANLSLKPEDATVSFLESRFLEFIPEQSIGDPKDFNLTVPNFALLAAATIVGESSLVTNLALRSLAVFTGAQPLVTHTAQDLMWGYDDKLITMAHTVAPSFIDFKRLGFLDRMYPQNTDQVVLRVGPNTGVDTSKPVASGVYSVQEFNGETGFAHFGHGVQHRVSPLTGDALPAEMPCDTVRGAYEGVLFPRKVKPHQRMYVYRDQFCRPVPIKWRSEGTNDDGFHYYMYNLYIEGLMNLDDEENTCFCASSAGIDGYCAPPGFSSITPCYYRMPVAMSQPHLLNIDPAYTSHIDGLRPDVELHDSFFHLQPDMGIPLKIRCRLQINLMMGKTRLSLTRRFNEMVLPLIWVEMEMDLPENIKSLLHLALHVGPAVQATLLTLLALAGVGMVVRGWFLRRQLRARHVHHAVATSPPHLHHHITALK